MTMLLSKSSDNNIWEYFSVLMIPYQNNLLIIHRYSFLKGLYTLLFMMLYFLFLLRQPILQNLNDVFGTVMIEYVNSCIGTLYNFD